MSSHKYPARTDRYEYRGARRRALRTRYERRTRAADLIAELDVRTPREVTLAFLRGPGDRSYSCRLLFTDEPELSWSAACGREQRIDTVLRDLRTAWDEAIRAEGWERRLDLTGPDADRWDAVFRRLAAAGQAAFEAIFVNHEKPAPMRELAEQLCARLRARRCVVGVWSNELFAPWGLLVLPPPPASEANRLAQERRDRQDELALDGAGAEGGAGGPVTAAQRWGPRFLGYRHLIEHRSLLTHAHCSASSIPRRNGTRAAALALVHRDAPPEHAEVIRVLADHTDLYACGSDATDFLAQLHSGTFRHQMIYVFSHGHGYSGDPARLYPSTRGGESIGVGQLLSAVAGGTEDRAEPHDVCAVHHLTGSPLMYFNVCRAGEFTPASGDSVTRQLSELGASCAITPELIAPKVLAVEHALRFLEPFLRDGVEVGARLRHLTRAFAREYGTLLGLMYGVKGRLDTRLGPTS